MNFILINPDEMRHDVLGCYGNPAAVTPNMDRLAGEGTLFENCFVQHTVCTPSRASFFTGLYPHNRGHRTLWNLLGDDEPNLLRYLKDNGYDVHLWGKNDAFDPEALKASVTTVNKGLENRHYPQNRVSASDQPGYYSFLYENNAETIEDTLDFRKTACAVDYLDSKPDNPFCLFLPLSFPHCPYELSKDYEHAIDEEKIPALRPISNNGKPDFHQLIRDYRQLENLSEDYLKTIMKTYLGMTSMIDAMVGNLVDALERNGLSDDTAIIIFSDHGDWAGDYGLVEKWPSGLDDALTHVPFIIKVPGLEGGNRIKAPVEMFDLTATVLSLAGIEANHTHFAVNLTPQLNGAEGNLDRTVFAEGGYDVNEPHCFEGYGSPDDISSEDPSHIYWPKIIQQQEHPESVARSVMARSLDYKLIRRSTGFCEFYDLKKDPGELNNIIDSPEYAEKVRLMETELLDWYLKTSDTVPVERNLRNFDPEVTRKLNADEPELSQSH